MSADKSSRPGVGPPIMVLLAMVASFAFLFGIFTALLGTSAVHQILTGVYFLIFTTALAGIGIISAIFAADRPNS